MPAPAPTPIGAGHRLFAGREGTPPEAEAVREVVTALDLQRRAEPRMGADGINRARGPGGGPAPDEAPPRAAERALREEYGPSGSSDTGLGDASPGTRMHDARRGIRGGASSDCFLRPDDTAGKWPPASR
jgi:8-oxo-dGTP pyrophosphatase MutT (NUDIX family)